MKHLNLKKAFSVLLAVAMILSLFACESAPGEETSETQKSGEGFASQNESESIDTEQEADQTGGSNQVESESATESESTEIESSEQSTEVTARGVDVISFVNYSSTTREELDLRREKSVAVSFTVPDGELRAFYLNLTNEVNYTQCDFAVDIYRFDGEYHTTVESEPIYSTRITSMLKTYTLHFEEGQIPAGDYLLEVRLGDMADEGTHSSVMKDAFWNALYLPIEYEQYNMKSYVGGKSTKKSVLCCAMSIEREKPVEEPLKGNSIDLGEMGEKVAKVILLAGQSNAVGVSESALLRRHIGDREYEKYAKGYSNVKIMYRTDKENVAQNRSDVFVDVKPGQGVSTAAFGPEVGLAAYLSEAYPDETFYIIKYAVGGTNTYANWNVNDTTRNQQLLDFKSTIDKGLSLLKNEGLDPKIVGFLWMQGEGDAVQFYYANGYYKREKALVEYIRETYAEYSAAEEIPFIDATVNDSGMFASWFLVNEMKLKYSKESGNNYLIDTVSHGLTTLYDNTDYAHYDSLSMLLLGRLFGDRLSLIFNGQEDDGICPHKESGYQSKESTHIKVCTLCGDLLTEEEHIAVTNEIVYDASTKSYKGVCVCGAEMYQELFFTTEARATTGGCENLVITSATEGEEYFVRYTQSGSNSRVRVYLLFGNTDVTGQHLVLKYRFVNNGVDAALTGTYAATVLSENPLARGNGDACGNIGTLTADGEWHYLVVDLAAKNAESNGSGADLQIIPDENGDYAIKYIRSDFTTATADGDCYLDVAYVGFADEAGAVERYLQ